jgi:transcriptional regulator
MYRPSHFREDRPEVMRALVAAFPLATIVRGGAEGPTADHVPLEFEPSAEGHGRLIGHVARSNPLWQISTDERLLVMFQGPQVYVSPNWYASKQESGKVVPTWNYVVVHARCSLRAIHDTVALRGLVERLTDRFEATQAHPWRVADAPADYTEALLKAIVGIELSIHHIEGKWKVSQNHPAGNRRSLIEGLEAQGSEMAMSMSRLVREHGDDLG